MISTGWLERLIANAKVAPVLGPILASSDTVESEGGRWSSVEYSKYEKNSSNTPPPFQVESILITNYWLKILISMCKKCTSWNVLS